MQKYIITFILICSGYSLIGQTSYIPLNLSLGAYWISDFKVYDNLLLVCDGEMTTYYEKDTSINTKVYHRLKNILQQNNTNCLPPYSQGDGLYSYIREDTNQHIIYYLLLPSYIEMPLTNFNLSVSDVVNECIPYTIIDSISYSAVNNNVRKSQWFYIPSIGPSRTIEGIGRTVNFPYCKQNDDFPYYLYELKCFKNNGQILYTKSINDSCNISIPLSTTSLTENKNLLPYHNNILEIPSEFFSYSINIFSIDGKQVYAVNSHNSSCRIDLSDKLPNGIYIAVFKSENLQRVQKCVVSK